jgi:TPP-dependent pyruvate/acetoin dehydrogenase alpha subunit
MTYRWREHVGPNEDYDLGYRSRDEASYWIENDQLKHIAEHIPELQRGQIESQIEQEIRSAIEFAESSPFPDTSELVTDNFKEA